MFTILIKAHLHQRYGALHLELPSVRGAANLLAMCVNCVKERMPDRVTLLQILSAEGRADLR